MSASDRRERESDPLSPESLKDTECAVFKAAQIMASLRAGHRRDGEKRLLRKMLLAVWRVLDALEKGDGPRLADKLKGDIR